jgi:hypothetical protein
MDKKKYTNHIYKHPIVAGDFGPKIEFTGGRDFGSNFSLICLPVTEPVLMEAFPHSHEFDMYLTFIGLDPNGLNDLGGEVEFCLGKEKERHIITEPTSVYIPKNMIHCPLEFKVVRKPLLLIHTTLASKYEKNLSAGHGRGNE